MNFVLHNFLLMCSNDSFQLVTNTYIELQFIQEFCANLVLSIPSTYVKVAALFLIHVWEC